MNLLGWIKRGRPAPAAEPEPQFDPSEVEEDSVEDLQLKLNALLASTKTLDVETRVFVVQHFAAALKRMNESMSKTSKGMRLLSVQSAHGASHLDPYALGRILDRMDSLGDATMRQIEGRIGVIVSREDRKPLQALRDEMRAWLDARDLRLSEAQLIVDELNEATSRLREELISKSARLAKAAEVASVAASASDADPLRQVSPEAAAFAETLYRLLEGTQF